MSLPDDIAAALDQVVVLGDEPTAAEVALAGAVAQQIAARPAAPAVKADPAVAAGLRALGRGEPCPLCGRGGEP